MGVRVCGGGSEEVVGVGRVENKTMVTKRLFGCVEHRWCQKAARTLKSTGVR